MPVWSASAYTKAINVSLNTTMRIVSGTLKPTKTEWLPRLCNIAPPAFRGDVLSSRYFSRILATKIPAQHLLTEHPCCHLKPRKPPWNHTELFTGAHQSEADLWRASLEAAMAPNKHIVHYPTIPPPGFTLPHRQWIALNRLLIGQGLCGSTLHRWRMRSDALCDCGGVQMMVHIMSHCP